jgi:uncharacterized protein (TIGR00369 family)
MSAEVVPVIEREPARGELWGPDILDRSGLEMMRASVEHVLPDPPITKLTGLRLSEVGIGVASATMPASLWWQSGAGVFLAGSIAFVADLPLATAVLSTAPAGTVVTSSELSVSFVRPATVRSGSIIGRARLIHSTRSLGLAEATVEDAHGRLLGHATSRCLLFRPERATLRAPAQPAPQSPLPDPYLRAVEGVVYGQEYWDSTAGIDVIRQVVAGEFYPPVFLLFGMRMPAGSEGTVTITMPGSAWLCTALGVAYGGALAMLADAAMTLAVASTVPAATAFSPLDMKIYFLRPARPGDGALSAQARVIHRGRTIAVVACDIVDGQKRVVAQASGSVLILPGRPWERPVHVADEFTQDMR